MKILLNEIEYSGLSNGSNVSPQNCTFRIFSSDATALDRAFSSAESFSVKWQDDDEWSAHDNTYDVIYVELRHGQEISYGEYGDVTTVYMRERGWLNGSNNSERSG